ncbi:MAG: extensin family protein [Xanthobacteraceae bacterium]
MIEGLLRLAPSKASAPACAATTQAGDRPKGRRLVALTVTVLTVFCFSTASMPALAKPASAAKTKVVPFPKPRNETGLPSATEKPEQPAKPAARSKRSPSAPPSAGKDDADSSIDRNAACVARLKASGIDADVAERPAGVKAECKIDVPVRLNAVSVRARSGQTVRFPAKPLMACRLAEAIGRWTGDLVAPLLAGALRSELASIDTGPGFECRFRNRARSGRLSAHANGLAIDIGGFLLANGMTIRVGIPGTSAADAALAAIRTAACGWFTTILGPGSDAAHRFHLHLDIITHGSSDRYRICL